MAAPIPGKILRSTVTVRACTGTDIYQEQTFDEYTVNRVHLQPAATVRKTADNTDMQLTSILFVDNRRSYPQLDWRGLLDTSHANGGDLYVTHEGVTYTVVSADQLRDDRDRPHHWEVGLK